MKWRNKKMKIHNDSLIFGLTIYYLLEVKQVKNLTKKDLMQMFGRSLRSINYYITAINLFFSINGLGREIVASFGVLEIRY